MRLIFLGMNACDAWQRATQELMWLAAESGKAGDSQGRWPGASLRTFCRENRGRLKRDLCHRPRRRHLQSSLCKVSSRAPFSRSTLEYAQIQFFRTFHVCSLPSKPASLLARLASRFLLVGLGERVIKQYHSYILFARISSLWSVFGHIELPYK